MKKLIIKELDFEFGKGIEEFKLFEVTGKRINIFIEMEIGFENEKGAELFCFNICNEIGLLHLLKNEKSYTRNENHEKYNKMISIKSMNIFIVDEFSPKIIISEIEEILDKLNEIDNNWNRIAMSLNKYFGWEYEEEFITEIKSLK